MALRIFFGDESTQKGGRSGMGKLIAFGGVFVEETQLRPLAKAIDKIATRYKIPAGIELKWSPPRKSWLRDNFKDPDRRNAYGDVMDAAKDHDVRALVVVWDSGRTTLQGSDAFEKCLDYVWERVEMHLKTVNDLGLIVADQPAGDKKEDVEFLETFLERMTTGTTFVPPDRVQLNILTTPSHVIRHLQIADLVTGITTAAVVGNEFGLALMPKVAPLFIRNSLGTIGGTGLKLFPDDELVNLYHHALGEDLYAKPSMNSGWGLPLERWRKTGDELPYFKDDGIGRRAGRT